MRCCASSSTPARPIPSASRASASTAPRSRSAGGTARSPAAPKPSARPGRTATTTRWWRAASRRPPPAATAIGTDGPPERVQLIALCSRAPAIALENPRQTPAWRYPREYGPVPPGFSRGVLLEAGGDSSRLLASGTASIVGHVSQHVGDVEAQLKESLANLQALLDEGRKKCGRDFRVEECEA